MTGPKVPPSQGPKPPEPGKGIRELVADAYRKAGHGNSKRRSSSGGKAKR